MCFVWKLNLLSYQHNKAPRGTAMPQQISNSRDNAVARGAENDTLWVNWEKDDNYKISIN